MMLYGAMKNMGVYFTSRPIHLRKSFSEKLKMEKQFYGEPFAGRTIAPKFGHHGSAMLLPADDFVHKWYLGQIWLLKIARGKYKCVNVSTWQTNQKKILKFKIL